MIGYYRVSTDPQAVAGFSLDGQRTAVRSYVQQKGAELIAEFDDVESAFRPTNVALDKRPGLRNALEQCKRCRARLVIAALDRLARNVVFIATLIETRVDFVALDIPDATPFMLHLYAAIAEEESRQKGTIIRAALAIAKARGIAWNQAGLRRREQAQQRAEKLRGTLEDIRASGIRGSYRVAQELKRRGVTRVVGHPWSTTAVKRMLGYLGYYEKAQGTWPERWTVESDRRAEGMRPIIMQLHELGRRDGEIADALNEQKLRRVRGACWTPRSVFEWRSRYAPETVRRRPRAHCSAP